MRSVRWTLGHAPEAAHACMQFGFTNQQAMALTSIVDPANGAAIKVATRAYRGQRECAGKSGPMLLSSTIAAQFAARPKHSDEPTPDGVPCKPQGCNR